MTSAAHSHSLIGRQPLAGRTILVTRAALQAAEFARQLESYGARIVFCPVIEIAAPDSYIELDDAIFNLLNFDWVIFMSVNGVEHFMRRLEFTQRYDAIDIDDLRVCAIGEATANRLRDFQIHVDVVPREHKSEGVFIALREYLGSANEFHNLRFLIPRAAVARDFLPNALRDAGAQVATVTAYQTVRPIDINRGRVEAMLRGGSIDCVTFTSASSVTNFADFFSPLTLKDLLQDIVIACIGDITAEAAATFNLKTDVLPSAATTEELAKSIALYFTSRTT